VTRLEDRHPHRPLAEVLVGGGLGRGILRLGFVFGFRDLQHCARSWEDQAGAAVRPLHDIRRSSVLATHLDDATVPGGLADMLGRQHDVVTLTRLHDRLPKRQAAGGCSQSSIATWIVPLSLLIVLHSCSGSWLSL